MNIVNKSINNFSKYNNQRVDASWVRIIFIALKKEKLPAEAILKEAGIVVDKLKEQEIVSQKTLHLLYDIIDKYDALNSLPIYITEVFQFHFLRHIGSILSDANTLDDLLSKIVFVISKLSHLIQADISTDAKYAKLNIYSAVTNCKVHPTTLMSALCLIVKVVQKVFPQATNAVVKVIVSEDAPITLLKDHFHCPLTVSKNGNNSVLFERNLLNTVNVFSTHSINVSKAISANSSRSDLNLYAEIEQLILKNISEPHFTIIDISQDMKMSVKTLQRLLSRFGTNFSELVQLSKIRLATFYLKENQLTNNQISFALGFISPSSFSRAFKKWTGQSPSQFQKSDE